MAALDIYSISATKDVGRYVRRRFSRTSFLVDQLTMRFLITAYLLFAYCLSGLSVLAQSKTLDFRTDRRLEILKESAVNLVDFGSTNRIGLPAGDYEILLPSGNFFNLEAVGGYITPEFNDDSNISKMVFKTRALTMSEALALADVFHDAFDLPKKGLSEWVDPFNKGGVFSGFYSIGSDENYPAMGIKLLSAYSRETPIIIQYTFTWHSTLMKVREVSPDTNIVKKLNYDMAEILARLIQVSAVSAETVDPVAEVVEEAAREEPAEVVNNEPIEEDFEQSSNWWLWFIGAVVVIGGIGVAVRHKS